MSVPVVPSKSVARALSDSDAELLWPPPDEAQFAIEVMDLQTRRVLTVHDVAADTSPAAQQQEPRAASHSREPGPQPASITTARMADLSASDAIAPNASHARFGEVAGETRDIPPLPRLSTPALVKALVAIVLLQALAITVFFLRGRLSGGTVPPVVSVAAPEARPAPLAAQPDEPHLSRVESPPPVARAASEGRLLVRSDPPGAVVAIDGRHRGTAPLRVDDLAAGSHRVQLGTSGSSIEQVVTIEGGTTTSLVVPMQSAGATAGWLNVAAPIDVQIFENGRLLGASADGPVRLAAGSHKVQLVNESLGYRGTETVAVRAGEVARVRPALPVGLLHVNAQPWANVSLDGEPVGETPLANIKVALGHHEIRFTHPSLGEQVRQVVVSATAPARVSVNMKP